MSASFLSIITANLNGSVTLAQSIDSVLAQDYRNFELIVIDGGSTDNSVAIIEERALHISYWCSARDNGISDALNKGLLHAQGEFVLFLHSDDYLLSPKSLGEVVSQLDGNADLFACNILHGNDRKFRELVPRGFGPWLNFKTGIFHQACWFRRAAFERIGGFDPQFKVAMDYEWFLRAYRAGLKCETLPFAFSFMRDSGLSSRSDEKSLSIRFAEERRAHMLHSRNGAQRLMYDIYWKAYSAYRRVPMPLQGDEMR